MDASRESAATYVPLAEVAIDAVRPAREGFELEGRGADGADYRLEMRIELPVDQTTRTVIGEMLAQSHWRIARRARQAPLRARRKTSARDATKR